jgi:hypothetical protein
MVVVSSITLSSAAADELTLPFLSPEKTTTQDARHYDTNSDSDSDSDRHKHPSERERPYSCGRRAGMVVLWQHIPVEFSYQLSIYDYTVESSVACIIVPN